VWDVQVDFNSNQTSSELTTLSGHSQLSQVFGYTEWSPYHVHTIAGGRKDRPAIPWLSDTSDASWSTAVSGMTAKGRAALIAMARSQSALYYGVHRLRTLLLRRAPLCVRSDALRCFR